MGSESVNCRFCLGNLTQLGDHFATVTAESRFCFVYIWFSYAAKCRTYNGEQASFSTEDVLRSFFFFKVFQDFVDTFLDRRISPDHLETNFSLMFFFTSELHALQVDGNTCFIFGMNCQLRKKCSILVCSISLHNPVGYFPQFLIMTVQ